MIFGIVHVYAVVIISQLTTFDISCIYADWCERANSNPNVNLSETNPENEPNTPLGIKYLIMKGLNFLCTKISHFKRIFVSPICDIALGKDMGRLATESATAQLQRVA
jgi:hypothetical protein